MQSIALGPRYIKKDFDFRFIHPIAKHDSGVQCNFFLFIIIFKYTK